MCGLCLGRGGVGSGFNRAEPGELLHQAEPLLLGAYPGFDFFDEVAISELGIGQ